MVSLLLPWGSSNNKKLFLGLSITKHSEGRDLLKERDQGQCRGQGSTEVASQAGTSQSGAAAHMDISKDHKVIPELAVQVLLM